jgi:hypothetical protein
MNIYAQVEMPAKRASAQKSGGNGAVGETTSWRSKDGLAAPQTVPRQNQVISAESFILLASPTGFEPVLSP